MPDTARTNMTTNVRTPRFTVPPSSKSGWAEWVGPVNRPNVHFETERRTTPVKKGSTPREGGAYSGPHMRSSRRPSGRPVSFSAALLLGGAVQVAVAIAFAGASESAYRGVPSGLGLL